MKRLFILSFPHSISLCPAHIWKIPCCHLLRQKPLSTNNMFKKAQSKEVGGKRRDNLEKEMMEERGEGTARGRQEQGLESAVWECNETAVRHI